LHGIERSYNNIHYPNCTIPTIFRIIFQNTVAVIIQSGKFRIVNLTLRRLEVTMVLDAQPVTREGNCHNM
jgi:hypothetical protein